MMHGALLLLPLVSGLIVSPRAPVHPRMANAALTRAAPLVAKDGLDEDTVQAKLATMKKRKRGTRFDKAPVQDAEEAALPEPLAIEPPAKVGETAAWLRKLEQDGRSPMERLRATVRERAVAGTRLDVSALRSVTSFLNEFFADGLLEWVLAHSDVGSTERKKNAWSRGSWTPMSATLSKMSLTDVAGGREVTLHIEVAVSERGKEGTSQLSTTLKLPPAAYTTVDELRTALLRLHESGDDHSPAAGGMLLRIPGATDDWSLPDDLWLNTTPYPRSVRQMFYDDVLHAMQSAVADPSCPRRMKVVIAPPELNMEMDSYRVGTLLELVRDAALGFAEHGLKTRICVQGSMGQGVFMGVPRVLSGVRKVLQLMDWQAGPGEAHEGVLGNLQESGREELEEGFVRLGAIGPDEVAADDDVMILLAPQSMVGASIYEFLSDMVDRATKQGTAVILINPLLQDRQSSGGLMSVRGRSERMAFASSFDEIYHFRLLYSGTTFMFPILGSVRMCREDSPEAGTAPSPNYVLFQRQEGGRAERYVPVGSFPGREPSTEEITELVPREVQQLGGSGKSPNVEASDAETPSPAVDKRMPASATDKFAPPSW